MGPKALGRLFGVVIFTASFVAANAGHDLGPDGQAASNQPKQLSNSVLPKVSADVIASRAQENFGTVFQGLKGNQSASIQVVVDTASQQKRHVWVTPVASADGGFLGKVTSADTSAVYPRQNDVILFQTEQVQDWLYVADNGALYGSFATRERLAHLTAHEEDQIRAILSETVAPTHWF